MLAEHVVHAISLKRYGQGVQLVVFELMLPGLRLAGTR
jgi:hypothetical protein